MGDCDGLDVGDGSAEQFSNVGLEPDVISGVRKLTSKHVEVCQTLLDVDCLSWIDMANDNEFGDIVGFTARFDERMMVDLNDSLFLKIHTDLARALPFLYQIAQERSGQPWAKHQDYENGVNTTDNKDAESPKPYQRPGAGVTLSNVTNEHSPYFRINRMVANTNNAISDFRAMRLSPATSTAIKTPPKCNNNGEETSLVAELWGINSQLRPISGLIKALEAIIQRNGESMGSRPAPLKTGLRLTFPLGAK